MAKKSAVNKELKLEDVLFNCRDLLRGKASLADKRDLLLTLVFLRFIGEKFTLKRQEVAKRLVDVEGVAEDSPMYGFFLNQSNFYDDCFFLTEEVRWETISAMKATVDLPLQLDNIIKALEDEEPTLRGALPQKIFSKSMIEPNVLKKVIDEVSKITTERFHEKDLIGRVYEYFLQAFALNAEKEEGEFYTPHSIVELIASIIEPYDGTIYDPCCGSGGMFVQSVKFVEAHGGNTKAINVYGQEQDPDTFRLAKMNLAVRGISHDLGDCPASTFQHPHHSDKKMDYIMANPPFNLKKWRTEEELTNDVRWQGYSVPPVSNANYAWILHMLSKLNVTKGVAGFLLANGALDDSDTVDIRQKLIENDKVEAIIVLPRNMFYSTDISVTLWILNQNKKGGPWHGRELRDRTGEILFMDLRSWSENVYEKKYIQLLPEQIAKVVDIYQMWQSTTVVNGEFASPELYRAVKKDEIEKNGWSLVPSRYIEFVDRGSGLDDKAILGGLNERIAEVIKKQQESSNMLLEVSKSLVSKLDEIKGTAPMVALREYVIISDKTNTGNGQYPVMGLNKDKEFMPTLANLDGIKLNKYKVVEKGMFAFSGMQTGRDVCIRISLSQSDTPFLISPAYTTFTIDQTKGLLPEFVYLWFLRSEIDRLGWFISDSSVRSNLDWPRFLDIKIPKPSMEVQKAIVDIYLCSLKAKEIAEEADQQLKTICPALMQHIIHG